MRFLGRLMLALGIASLRELYNRVDADMMVWWAAYDRACGLPDPWYQTGQTCAVVAAFSGNAKRNLEPHEFMPIEVDTQMDDTAMIRHLMAVSVPAKDNNT